MRLFKEDSTLASCRRPSQLYKTSLNEKSSPSPFDETVVKLCIARPGYCRNEPFATVHELPKDGRQKRSTKA